MCDTLTGQKARLICAAGPAPCVIGGTLMRDEPCVRARAREHARTDACVHAGDGACACATKYGRADRMTDGGTPGATESGDSRDTSSHSPTHFRLELNLLSLLFYLLFFSSSSTGFLPVSSSTLVLRACLCTVRVRTHDGLARLAWIDRRILFFLRLIFDVPNPFMYILEPFRNQRDVLKII